MIEELGQHKIKNIKRREIWKIERIIVILQCDSNSVLV